ncbi:hypothetical protein GF336_04020 [Candidatus Woesearchaeota archaeon]|nr:hypothetical protein [Candidatus Woesearchaeota archaeon]
MPLAVTHVLLTIIAVDIYRDHFAKHKRYFTLHTLFIAGLAGLLPDIDIVFRIIADFFSFDVPILLQHGGITHTLIFGLIFLIPGFMLLKKEQKRAATYFFVIAFGITFHIFLDFFLGGGAYEGIMWFWPLSTSTYKLHILAALGLPNIPEAIDALILLGWLWHEEVKHKIKDFI